MEFMSRGRPAPAPHHQSATPPAPKRKRVDWATRTVGLEVFLVMLAAALLILVLGLWLAAGNYRNAEAGAIKSNQYQAVFLTNNQVYFGKITDINKSSLVLTDVFYIETPNQAQGSATPNNSNYTLRKLGTNELHAPEDKMVINRDQVTFWENLKDSGQVTSKIKEYKKNPEAANQAAPSQPSTQQTPTVPAPSSGN